MRSPCEGARRIRILGCCHESTGRGGLTARGGDEEEFVIVEVMTGMADPVVVVVVLGGAPRPVVVVVVVVECCVVEVVDPGTLNESEGSPLCVPCGCDILSSNFQ